MIEGQNSPAGYFREGEALGAAKMNILADFASRSLTTGTNLFNMVQGVNGMVYLENQVLENPVNIDYPFKVICTTDGTGTIFVYVRPGTANNRMPKIDSKYLDDGDPPKLTFTTFSMTKKKIVALKLTYSTPPTFFPMTSEIVLLDNEEALTDSDTNGFLQLASLTGEVVEGKAVLKSINQFIFASQVVVRAKPGSGTAVWSFLSR